MDDEERTTDWLERLTLFALLVVIVVACML